MVDLYICGTYSPRYSLVMFHLLINNIDRYSDEINQFRVFNPQQLLSFNIFIIR